MTVVTTPSPTALLAAEVAGSAVERCEAHADGEFQTATVNAEVCRACEGDDACAAIPEVVRAPPQAGAEVTPAVASTTLWQDEVDESKQVGSRGVAPSEPVVRVVGRRSACADTADASAQVERESVPRRCR